MDKAVIPHGDYCYSGRLGKELRCPYWSIKPELPEQENGYCTYLGKSDWDLNEEGGEVRAYNRDGKLVSTEPAHSVGMSWIWDQVKVCGVNEKSGSG